MKKTLSLFLAVLMVLTTMSSLTTLTFAANAEDLSFALSEDYEFYYVDHCNRNASGEIEIPATYNGKPVLFIDTVAFYKCNGITSVIIPNSVTHILAGAFSGCTGLTSVTIPDSVTIGGRAFSGCSSLTEVTFAGSVTDIGKDAFSETPWFNNQPDGIVYAGTTAYIYKGTMPENTSVAIKDGTKVINTDAFDGCRGLISVTIPNSVAIIGDSAFSRCSGLKAVAIPSSVTSIGEYAFHQCSGLTSVTVDNGNEYFSSENDVIFNKTKTELIYCAGGKTGKYSIPNSVTGIGYDAFCNCKVLTSVTIPNSVTKIGALAFSDCIGLTSVTIPDSVTDIGDAAFSGCRGLKSVKISNSLTEAGWSIFKDCIGLTSVTLPDSLTIISDSMFMNCNNLKTVNIPDSVTCISCDSFSGCKALTSVTIPDSVTWMSGGTFAYCTGLTSVTIPDSVTKIGGTTFYGCSGLKSVKIGCSVESIGMRAFGNCKNLKSVKIPSSVKEIEKEAFSFYFDKNKKRYKVADFTIYGVKGTVAQSYAKSAGCKFTSLPDVAVISSLKNTSSGIKITWGKVSGATGYRVYRKASSDTKWISIAKLTKNTAVSYTDKDVKNGATYAYTIRAYNSAGPGFYSKIGSSIKRLVQPVVTVKNAANAVTVKWSKVAGATGYYVYRKAGQCQELDQNINNHKRKHRKLH